MVDERPQMKLVDERPQMKWGKCESCYWNEEVNIWLQGICPLKSSLKPYSKCDYFRPAKITRKKSWKRQARDISARGGA